MTPSRGARRILGAVPVLIAIVGLVAAACSATPAASQPGASQPGLTVADAWVRPAPAGGESAAYLTITNHGTADALVSVHCSIAGSTMLHQTSTDASGMTGMSMVDRLTVPAGATVRLAPGGAHVMMSGLTKALLAGATLDLQLMFEHAGELDVSAVIRPG